jgi:hypothetical protein
MRYVHTPQETLRAGDHIRALLTPEGVYRVMSQADGDGAGLNGQTIRGKVLNLDAEDIRLAVPWARVQSRDATRTLNQSIVISRSDVLQVELRETDYVKTAGVVVLGSGAVTAVLVKSLSGTVGGSTPPERGGRGGDNVASPRPLPP